MKIIKYFLFIKQINNSSKIINFNFFSIKIIKKCFILKYNNKFINNLYKNKIIKKQYKKNKKNEFFM
ncbi:MAG: hypothetical protein ACH6QP_00285 [Candidatus Carsonella ruddii]